MDPLSISASVSALLALSSTVIKYIADVRGASASSKKILVEISLTRGILESIQSSSDDATLILLYEPVHQYELTLNYLRDELAPRPHRHKGAIQALEWPFKKDKIQEILTALERQKSLFILALQNDLRTLSSAIKQQQDGLVRQLEEVDRGLRELRTGQEIQQLRLDDQKRQEILSWISSLDFGAKQNDVLRQRSEKTGTWFLESRQFEKWLAGDQRVLWCPGPAGAGKTVLSSTVIDDLTQQFQKDPNIGIAWIYFDYRDQDRQILINLVASLVQQLARTCEDSWERLSSLYDAFVNHGTRPTLEDLSEILQLQTTSFDKTFLIVDALDECSEREETRRKFVRHLEKLPSTVQLLVTSRPLPAIHTLLGDAATLEIRADTQDVRSYLEVQLENEEQLQENIERDPSLRESILSTVAAKAQGMFLLVRLYVTSLAQYDSPQKLRKALQELPKDYTKVYDQIMNRIQEQPPIRRDRTLEILSWLAFARAPLSARALQHALAVERGDVEITENALPNLNRILSHCLGLAFIDAESQQVRWIHYTTQEYFDSEERKLKLLPDGQKSISTACLNYLSLAAFSGSPVKKVSELNAKKNDYPMFEYAARNWGHHARGAIEETLLEQIIQVLNNDNRRLTAHQCWNKDYADSNIHVAAAFGLTHVVRHYLGQGVSASVRNDKNRTPLHRVAEEGDYDDLARLLLDNNALVDARTNVGWTPLHEAAKAGNVKVMRVLIERGADVHIHNIHAAPPFFEATKWGRLEAMRILLDEGVDVKGILPARSHISPLQMKSGESDEPTLLFLLQQGADVNQPHHDDGRTPLHCAATHGALGAAKTLIDWGADVTLKDRRKKTPLAYAAEKRHVEITQLLLRTETERLGISHSLVPLHDAVERGQLDLVKLLVEQDRTQLKWKDERKRNALRIAQQLGNDEIASFLLETAEKQLEDALESF
ncbi:MAG: hypothetical protein M4579_000648 [Chaenotheca gracillima]|nr:MAG: hypothetical protein M4579_000648 [Chaenotheca gracillima]